MTEKLVFVKIFEMGGVICKAACVSCIWHVKVRLNPILGFVPIPFSLDCQKSSYNNDNVAFILVLSIKEQ
jgi:hypothetical protein